VLPGCLPLFSFLSSSVPIRDPLRFPLPRRSDEDATGKRPVVSFFFWWGCGDELITMSEDGLQPFSFFFRHFDVTL